MLADRATQILDAAATAFARDGFHATTVANIAGEAGISQGLLYRYFDGKEGLIIALVERITDALARTIEASLSLDAALDALYAPGETPGEEQAGGALLVEVLAEAIRNPRVAEVVRQADARVAAALADRLRDAQRAREVSRQLDPAAAAEVLMALADGFALRAALADAEPPGLEAAVASSGDAVAVWLVAFLGQVKAFSLFSFLFGYGLAIQLARAAARGEALGPRYARRLVGIFAFGVVHAVFLFTGDVLTIYAGLGAVLWLTRRWSPRRLVGLAGAAAALAALAYGLIAWPVETDAATAAAKAGLAIGADQAFSGSFAQAVGQRLRDLPVVFPFLVLYNGPLALALFALGLAAGKVELLSDLDRHWSRMRRALPWALGVGLAGNLAYAMTSASSWVAPAWVAAAAMASVAVAGPALTYGAVMAIAAAERAGRAGWLLRPLRAAGRLSLTNYLGESLLAGFVFGGWGLGLYGRLGPLACLLLTPVLFGALAAFSALWLRAFRYGPAEWVLRSWTYLRLQPLWRPSPPRPSPAPTR